MSPAQRVAINRIVDVRRRRTDAKAEIEARVRQAVRDELNALDLEYALEIRRAKELEVTISTIGAEGMGTADRGTVHRWLKKTERLEIAPTLVDGAAGGLMWEDKAQGTIRVMFAGFPTTITDPDYPETIEGVAKPDAEAPNGWAVVSDPGTVETQMGPLKGWFSVEIEDVPKSSPGSMTSVLDQWLAENR